MHLSESYQLKPEEVTIRDTAELYKKIEQNTQFLTNIIRHQFGRYRSPFNIEIQQIQIKSFFNAIVQVSYLLYFCTIKKISLFINREIYLSANRDNPQIIFQFILEKQMINLSEQKQRHLSKLFFFVNPFKHESSYAFCLIEFIKNTLEVLRAYLAKHKDKKVLGDKVLMKQLQSFQFAINMLQPQIKNGLRPKTLISCLQETQVFRVYSGLLKTLNCSIYENIRKTGKIAEIICSIKKQQIKFAQKIQQLKTTTSSECQYIQKEQQIIESEISSFFQYLASMKLIVLESTPSNRKSRIPEEQSNNQKILSYQIKVQVKGFRKFSQELVVEIDSGNIGYTIDCEEGGKKFNTFEIEIDIKRRIMCIKCFIEAQISVQNCDALMYHCNNMMSRWENASMELIQMKSGQGSRKKEKIFSFKVLSHFYPKDSPFLGILLGIDMSMIYGKISDPALSQDNIRLDDYNKFMVLGKKIEHLSYLFIKKIKRLYENLALKAL